MKNSMILVALATLITCSITIARADSSFEPRSVVVRFADLDTVNTQGAAALYRRLMGAAENVCQDLDPGMVLARKAVYAKCIGTALSNAIVKVDRPAVTAYAAAHGVQTGESTIKIASNK